MKKQILGALAFAISMCAVGCGGGGGGGASVDPYYHSWYDVYGVACYNGNPGYAAPGCNFYGNGAKETYYQDREVAPLQYGTYEYYDSYGYDKFYTGWARLTGSGLLFDDNGYALNEEGQTESRDLIGDVASKEQSKIQEVGKSFASKHALSEVTGIKIAQDLNDWAVLGKKHGRTEADIADYSKRIFGVTIEQAKPAIIAAQHGDLNGLTAINNDVATHWNTNPETSKEILTTWYQSEIAAATSSK